MLFYNCGTRLRNRNNPDHFQNCVPGKLITIYLPQHTFGHTYNKYTNFRH